MHVCIYVCMYICVYVYVYVNIYECVYVSKCVYIHKLPHERNRYVECIVRVGARISTPMYYDAFVYICTYSTCICMNTCIYTHVYMYMHI